MSNIHNNWARSARVDSAADNKAMERTFYLAVDVHVHASPADTHESCTQPAKTEPRPPKEYHLLLS